MYVKNNNINSKEYIKKLCKAYSSIYDISNDADIELICDFIIKKIVKIQRENNLSFQEYKEAIDVYKMQKKEKEQLIRIGKEYKEQLNKDEEFE